MQSLLLSSHRGLGGCGGKPPRCTLQTRPCCSLAPSAHRCSLSAAAPPRRWSPSPRPAAARPLRCWGTWRPPTWPRLPPLSAGIPRKNTKPGPSPEAAASTGRAGHRRASSGCLSRGRAALRHTEWHDQVAHIHPLSRVGVRRAGGPTAYELQAVDQLNLFGWVCVKVSEGRIGSQGETLEVLDGFR